MDIAPIMQWLSLILAAIALMAHAKNFFGSDGKEATKDIKVIQEVLSAQDRRLQEVENEIRHLPDRDSQHRVELALAEMNGRFAALEEKLKPIASTSERLHQLLLDQAKK